MLLQEVRVHSVAREQRQVRVQAQPLVIYFGLTMVQAP
jgi:hypothetical protein